MKGAIGAAVALAVVLAGLHLWVDHQSLHALIALENQRQAEKAGGS
jgi:hypothetical protein